jgi:outer membrane protein assembly factor BamB
MRRASLSAGALAVVLAVVAAGLYVRGQMHPRAHLVEGSTTTQFTPAAPRPERPPAGIAWPTYGYDDARLRNVSLRLRPPFRRVWTFHGRALLEFPPAVAYGLLFLPTFDGRFYALDARTGAVRWERKAGRCGWASPAVAAHTVFVTFVGSTECHHPRPGGEVDAFAATTGALRWRRELGSTESSPLVAGGDVVIGDWNGDVWALDTRTGRTRWRVHLDGAVKGSVARAGARLFIGTYGGSVYALSARTGGVLWRSGGHGRFYSSPAVAYGRVFVGSLDDGVYAFGEATGDVLWTRPTGGYVYASAAVARGLVLVGSYDRRFYALSAGTGAVRWRLDADGRISGAAAVVDGVVYFSTFSERTYAVRVADGVVLQTWPDGKYSPVVADPTHLYLVGEGRLYALTERRGDSRGSRSSSAPAATAPTRRSS